MKLLPSRNIPITRWRAKTQWRLSWASVPALLLGLWLFGTGEAMLINAGIGVSPWTVLAQGLSIRTGMLIGTATIVISVVVLLLWIPLKQKPGVGTIANILVIAVALQVMLIVLPTPSAVGWQLLQAVLGTAAVGLGSGFYLTAGAGPGPRDGWMTGMHNRFGWPVWIIRSVIEAVVLVLGWLLGGEVGIGTVIFLLLIGPFVGYGLAIAGWLGGAHTFVQEDVHPELEA